MTYLNKVSLNTIGNYKSLLKPKNTKIMALTSAGIIGTQILQQKNNDDIFLDRKNLQQTTSDLGNLNGPEEVKRAKKAVAIYAADNAAAGALGAQLGGLEELVLGGVEVLWL